jgi:hypothetical protein
MVMLVAVGAVFKLMVDDLWSKIQDGDVKINTL